MDRFTPDIKLKLDFKLSNQVIMAVFNHLTFNNRISFLNLEDRQEEPKPTN